MTPQERQLIDDLFDRLAKLENAPRDPEAMSAIMQGLRKAPNAVYALVQTALVQDEALKRANDRIQAMEAAQVGEQNQSGGFLDSMRDAVFGQDQSRAARCRRCVPPTWAAARSGTAARPCSSRNRRDMASRPTASPLARRNRRLAAVVVRSSAPQRRPPPARSVGRCCLAASGT